MQDQPVNKQITFLRRPEVQRRTGLSRSQIYLMMSKGVFPRPVPLSENVVGWLSEEIEAWQQTRIAARQSRQGQPVFAGADLVGKLVMIRNGKATSFQAIAIDEQTLGTFSNKTDATRALLVAWMKPSNKL